MVNDKRIIYLVDDDDDDRMIIRQAVHQLMDSVNIIEFSSGYDFLANLVGQWPSDQTLVLMDINMPRMSGLEVIKAMQSDPASKFVPVLAISTATDKTLIDKVIASGAYGYFEKPVTYEQIGELATNIKDFYTRHYAAS
ncbi:response regulator [Dyadobacter sp. CY347]|uniref:response regulator n=1 Tax=Dyadobacter sp. CY347 TaxID=2909336 RepID=UPI001F1B2C7B|nr:response regulator [Dyadobacter sp. CY347]MCF2489330.1 response regulator [Dyadobacter sp. CY347]